MQLDQSPTSPHLLGRLLHRLSGVVPPRVRSQLDAYAQALRLVREIDNPAVLRSMGPSAVRGLFLHRGTQGVPTPMPAAHTAHFDWTYPADQPEMALLYRRAKEGQWDGDSLPWDTDVDPLNPERPLIPREFLPIDDLVGLSPAEERKLGYIGKKRYTRLTITPSANASAALLSSVAILGNPSKAPVTQAAA